MGKFLKKTLMLAMLLSLGSSLMAQDPYFVFDTQTFDKIGGDSVASDGEWSMITQETTCQVRMFRLNYPDMTWGGAAAPPAPAAILSPFDPATTCPEPYTPTASEFGVSSAISFDVAVVGLPGWDGYPEEGILPYEFDAGGVQIFIHNGAGNWTASNQLNDGSLPVGSRVVLIAAPPQSEERFGESVAVARVPDPEGLPDTYLIAVGAPGTGGSFTLPLGVGKVWIYTLTVTGTGASDNSIALNGVLPGSVAEEQMGASVTINYPYVLAGGPGANGGNGRAVLVNVNAANQPVNGVFSGLEFPGNGFTGFGREVSLTDDLMLVATTYNVATYSGPPPYNVAGSVIYTGGGDVSQSAGNVAFGIPGYDAVIFRDVLNDEHEYPDSEEVDLKPPSTGSVGYDISLIDEFLFLSDPSIEEDTILVSAPCGWGKKLPALRYQILSIPCDLPAGTTVDDVFGGLGDIGDKSEIRLYRYDATKASAGSSFTEITAKTDVFGTDIPGAAQDYGFFVIVATEKYWGVPAGMSMGDPSFTTSDEPANTVSTVKAMREVNLAQPQEDPDGGDDFSWTIVANPFPRAFSWSELTWVTTGDEGSMIDAAPFLEDHGHIYDPDVLVGNPYKTVGVTPGFDLEEVKPYEGFYIKALADSAGQGLKLRLPQSE